MSQSTSTPADPLPRESENGDGHPDNRALTVREYEMHGLSPYMAPSAPGAYLEGTPAGMNFTQLMHALRRRWLLSLIVGLMVGAPVAALVWVVTPENYDVMAGLRVGDPPGATDRSQTEYEAFRKTQAQKLKSVQVLQAAYRKEGISDLPMLRAEREPLQFLSDELSVVTPLESEVILIKMRGKDAKQLVKIVNAVQDAYLELEIDAEKSGLLKQQELLQTAYRDKGEEIRSKRKVMNDLKNKIGYPDLEQVKFQLNQMTAQANTLLQSKSETRRELARVEQRIAVLEHDQNNGEEPNQHMIETFLSRDDVYADLTKRKNDIEQARSYLMSVSRLKENDPAVKRYDSMLAGIDEALQKRKEVLYPQIVEFLKSNSNDPREESGTPAQLKVRQAMLSTDLEAKQGKYNDLMEQVTKLAKSSSEIDDLDAELKSLDQQRGKLNEQLDKMGLDIAQDPRVKMWERATEPEGANPVFRYVLTIFAGIAGLAIGSGAVVAMEYQARRLSTSGEIGANTGMRVLGVVPNLDALSRAKGANGAAALQGILAESVDSIRTVLLQQTRESAPRLIMVTSAGDREGKTTVASHLAASLARSGHRTLLVDGDLRSPTAHAMFGAALDPGLCEMLRGEIDLEGAIQPTQVDGLMLVAAGACDYQSIAALGKGNLHEIFQKAREQFEFVVIDAAPVLNYADTLLMAAHVDAAVLSVRRDVSQLHKVYEARERMESVGIRILGAVVNGITETSRRPAFALPS